MQFFILGSKVDLFLFTQNYTKLKYLNVNFAIQIAIVLQLQLIPISRNTKKNKQIWH